MIPTKENIDEYVKYLKQYQPIICPRSVADVSWVPKTETRPGTTTEETHECPTWKNSRADTLVDWQPFYSDIQFPAFIYDYRFNAIKQDWY